MFNKFIALFSGSTPTPAAVTTTGSAAAAVAPATVQGTRADLIEIRVNGIDDAKANAVWLTKGLDRGPATAVRLVDLTSDHLKNIVQNKPNLSPDYLRVITAILEDRGETLPTVDPDATDADDNDGFSHLS
jgi:hypothetical protein